MTSNEPLVARLWETYLNLPEDQLVLTFGSAPLVFPCLTPAAADFWDPPMKRLFSPCSFLSSIASTRTQADCKFFHLSITCVNLSRNLLTRTPSGSRVCIGILDDMIRLHEADEGSDAAKAFDTGSVVYTALGQLFSDHQKPGILFLLN